MPVIAPVVNPDNSANRLAEDGPCSRSSPRHFHSAAVMPRWAATASWKKTTASLNSRPIRSPWGAPPSAVTGVDFLVAIYLISKILCCERYCSRI